MPLTITFRKANGEVYVDPTKEEEAFEEGRLTMEISKPEGKEMINAMQKGGNAVFSIEEIDNAIQEAKKIFAGLHKFAEDEIKKAGSK